MSFEKGCRKDKNQNIKVFVRLRPLNQRERDIRSKGVVEVVNGREVVVRQSHQTSYTKRFTFDRAFPPTAKQVEVYQEVVGPLIEEVLKGYNCTVFAYGQTGTGKTHTMVGEKSGIETTWQDDPLAGIIPRALSQLFDELHNNTAYTVRVSYLELYNEELFDLLSASDDNSKLKLYSENVAQKRSNIVHGLEEITVYNKNEVYKIMAQGHERKRVASTLMNAQSSRSHTVFTIMVHMKESSPEGEELMKIGKLNLVDLAGSENISKAGSDCTAKKERARAANINQSLLTLGRVIIALSERHPHIPYRESKLTRILQESLGGGSKTSVIGTISPGDKDLEVTMSTLEYINRAKNIQNKPQVNQKMSQKAILNEYEEEINKLKRELKAAREENGMFLANKKFVEMTQKQEELKKKIEELLARKLALEEERDRTQMVFDEVAQRLQRREEQLATTTDQLGETRTRLNSTCDMLEITKRHYEESQQLVSARAGTERALTAQAAALLAAVVAAVGDVTRLHDTLDKRTSVESKNLEITQAYRDISAQHRDNITHGLDSYNAALTRSVSDLKAVLDSFTSDSSQTCADNKQRLEQVGQATVDMMKMISDLKTEGVVHLSREVDVRWVTLEAALRRRAEDARAQLAAAVRCVRACVRPAQEADMRARLERLQATWHTKLSSLSAAQAALRAHHVAAGARRVADVRARSAATRQRLERRRRELTERIDIITAEEEDTDRRLAQEIQELESDRAENERRLEEWLRLVESERKAIDKVKGKIEKLEVQRRLLKERPTKELERSWLREITESLQVEEDYSKQCIKEAEDDKAEVEEITEKWEIGYNEISSNMNSLIENALGAVFDDEKNSLVNEQQAEKYVDEQSNMLIDSYTEEMNQNTGAMRTFVSGIVEHFGITMDNVERQVKGQCQSTVSQISTLSISMTALGDSIATHQATQSETLASVQGHQQTLYDSVRTELARLAEMEGRCLSQEYAVYSPTGMTPARTEYRYPRALAATSPDERILARFRARQHHTNDDDCIIVESEGESASDTDSPSPPAQPTQPPAQPTQPPIVRSTSDTDIYHRRRVQEQQGKEEVKRSMSFEEPSKLPAPASTDKPLIERNDN